MNLQVLRTAGLSSKAKGTPLGPMQVRPRKFETLDALRGAAALLVVWHHFHGLFGRHDPRHIYLAVDLFFGLSGFVLSHAYQARLDNGLSTAKFILTRFVRLWPLYLIGFALGLAFPLTRGEKFTPGAIVWQLFMLPDWRPGDSWYPANGPLWTLTFEIFANAVHAIFLRRRSTVALSVWAAISGGLLAFSYSRLQYLDGGWSAQSFFALGAPRVLFSYLMGMLVFRAWDRHGRTISMPAWVPVTGLILVLLLPVATRFEAVYLFLTLAVLLPAVVFAGALSEPKGALLKPFAYLGIASYAIYVLHEPLGIALIRYWPFPVTAEQLAPAPGLMLIAVLIVTALWLDKAYDQPVRKYLRRTLKA